MYITPPLGLGGEVKGALTIYISHVLFSSLTKGMESLYHLSNKECLETVRYHHCNCEAGG